MGRRIDRYSETQRVQQRARVAQEAARLISEHGIKDFRVAKSKAALGLGLTERGALPSNREIEAALAERNRIFSAADMTVHVRRLRAAAVDVMHALQVFSPCLVGPVLSGVVTEHSPINLHCFSDAAESVSAELQSRGIHAQAFLRRHRLRHDQFEEFPGYEFWTDDLRVETTVFPERRKGHPPLSPIDGKPMQRARAREVELLLTAA